VAALTGLTLGEAITPQAVGTVLTHPSTYRSKIPPAARHVVYISHVRHAADVEQARLIAAGIDRSAVEAVLGGDTPSGTFYDLFL
jgi:hypothetical protein